MKTIKRLSIILVALLMPAAAFAQTPVEGGLNIASPLIEAAESTAANIQTQIEFIEEISGNVKLQYPKLKGLENTDVEQKINDAIKQAANVDNFIAIGKHEHGSGTKISSEACILTSEGVPYIFSALISVEGRLISGMRGHEYIPLMFFLETGEPVETNDIFNSCAQEKIDEWLDDELDNMSFYDISEAFPVPINRSVLTKTGITISYPQNSFKFLSDRSAAFSFYYYELEDMLNLSDGSLLSKLDVFNLDNSELDKENLSKGELPNVPNILGKPVQEVLENYKELTDPERFVSAERYVLEAPEFRSIYPIVNDGDTAVSGILAKRIAIAGCVIDISKKQDIIKSFGEPIAVLPLEGVAAEQYFVPEGEGLMYNFNGFSVMITIDKQDVFTALLIQKEGA